MSEAMTATKPPVAEKLIVVSQGRPPYPTRAQAAFGIAPGDWRALVDAIWPSAKTTEAVELALAYCRARHLDPFKRPVHIVPVWDSKQGREIETIWPGIGELRTTAARTGQHAGNDDAIFGPEETRAFKGTVGKGQYAKEVEKTVTFPAWCQFTVYRMLQGQRVPFKGPKVYWLETYSTMGATDVPTSMWEDRPYGQIEKCCEAAALRRAFPEEVGSDYIHDEISRRGPAIEIAATPEPHGARTQALAERLKALQEPPSAEAEEAPQESAQEAEAGAMLDPATIADLRDLATSQGVSMQAIEEVFCGPLEDQPATVEAQVVEEINRRAKRKP